MLVAMQDEFNPVPDQHILQRLRIVQPAPPTRHAGQRWMMDEQNAHQPRCAKRVERFGKTADLGAAEPPGGDEGGGGAGRRRPDERDIAKHLYIREQRTGIRHDGRASFVRAHVVRPEAETRPTPSWHIRIVIAGYHADLRGIAEGAQPGQSALELVRQRQVHEVARHGDVIRIVRVHVRDDRRESIRVMHAPATIPVQVAE